MTGCFPFRMCLECLQGPSFTATQSYAHLREEVHNIKLDTGHMGPDVVLLKMVVEYVQTGTWGVGLATKTADLSKAPLTSNAWTLNNEEGDTIGIGFDHVELRFFKGEEAIPLVVPNIRGQVYPVLYVEDNAILDAKFSSFLHLMDQQHHSPTDQPLIPTFHAHVYYVLEKLNQQLRIYIPTSDHLGQNLLH
uniref:SPRY domain-containing protein n=1 Tax=Ditylenchus dipsaci TaxID=166011 RepID=A0A915EKN7_9BILA